MPRQDWKELKDSELERLFVERWLYRGALVAGMIVLAVLVTLMGARGVNSPADKAMVGLLVAFATASFFLFLLMRRHDFKIQQELRQRRRQRKSP